MSENMKKFLETLATDEGLQSRMQGAKSPEEAFAMAKEAVEGLEIEEFSETMKKIHDLISRGDQAELTDDDLDLVAGGWSQQDSVIVTTVVSAAAALTPIALMFI